MVGSPQRHTPYRVLCWRVFCLLAIVFMLLLVMEHLGTGGGMVAALCQLSEGLSCEETLLHPAARLLGLPMPYWAIACYSLLFFVGPESWGDRFRRRLAGGMVFALILSSLFFLLIMERDLVKPCPLCLATHLCHLLLVCTFLAAGRAPSAVVAAGAGSLRRLPLALPLALLLLAALLTLRQQEVRVDAERLTSLAAPDLLADLVYGDFDRFYPARPEHRIRGEATAPLHLVIVGSLSCSHCRDLVRAVPTLGSHLAPGRLAISFIPYPLAEACNPNLKGKGGRSDQGQGECRLAAETTLAQQQGRFWAWFAEVDKAPGRVRRRLASQAAADTGWHLDQDLVRLIDTLAAIPVTAVPTLLWQGQKLPAALGGLPLARLIDRLIEAEARESSAGQEADCGC